MAKTKEKDNTENENVKSILGKIKNVVSGKEKVTIEDEKPEAAEIAMDDDEPMELTEIVENDAAAAEPAAATEGEAAPKTDEDNFVDILKEIDSALEKQYKEEGHPDDKPAEAPLAAEAVVVEPQPEPVAPQAEEPVTVAVAEPVAEAPNANLAQAPVENVPEQPIEVKKEFPEEISQNIISNQVETNMTETKTNILSDDIANKSSKAIQNLLNNIPRPDIDSPAFRSATTLEDVVIEMVKPMLKEWLDKNLEVVVRDIVEKEIKKIIPRD